MSSRERRKHWTEILVVAAAMAIAVVSAKPFAGSWNDGSRLATVESLVDRGTFVIDDSIFVNAAAPSPYPPNDQALQNRGTRDKLFIDGHFYSDKSPVLAVGMAAIYQVWRWLGGPSAAEHPDRFCLLMNGVFGGLAYVVSVWCIFAIGRKIGLDRRWQLIVTAFFGLGTTALPYAQHVNNHEVLLAIAAPLFLIFLTVMCPIGERRGVSPPWTPENTAGLRRAARPIHSFDTVELNVESSGWTTGRSIAAGCLLGLGYTVDLAAGPMLVISTIGLLICSRVNRVSWALVLLAALPCFVLHHALNYAIGGTFGPANAVPEYLNWPGSPFDATSMTGGWKHESFWKASAYSFDMLYGKKGFLGHNLVLLLPLAMLPWLIRQRFAERRIVLTGLCWATGTWLLYSLNSTNQSGACCSIRWFVPLLVPGFVALAVVLRDYPSVRIDALIFGSGSLLLGLSMAWHGPWFRYVIPGFWPIYLASVLGWAGYRLKTRFAVDSQMRSAFANKLERSAGLNPWYVRSKAQDPAGDLITPVPAVYDASHTQSP